MTSQAQLNYQRIEQAIAYLHAHFKEQPSLDDIAAAVQLSPYHFQRLFSEWAGVSPKKFIQYLTLSYAKGLLEQQSSLMDAAYESGLSGSSRLHDLFIHIEGMTPGEYKLGGKGLQIHYSVADSPFGPLVIASTPKGLCYMAFEEMNGDAPPADLTRRFPKAEFLHTTDNHQKAALAIFQKDWQQLDQIKLHLSGTPFQLKVWEALLKIPLGGLTTYGTIAQRIGQPNASRAVGTAIGSNPISFLIPCHRVIQNSGQIGGYMWGANRKSAIIGWEASQIDA